MLQDAEDWTANTNELLTAFEEETGRETLYSIVFF